MNQIIMFFPLLIIAVIIVIGAILSRGKQLKCPDCEHVFNAPIMEQKASSLGLTFPYMGTIKCPNCSSRRTRRDFDKVEKTNRKSI